MSLSGASRAVVPVPAGCPAALLTDPGAGTASAVGGTAIPGADRDDELTELAEPPEHPASSIPPASMAPPIARPAAPNRVRRARASRRFKLSVFSMPL